MYKETKEMRPKKKRARKTTKFAMQFIVVYVCKRYFLGK
jgi:hypothetical protein